MSKSASTIQAAGILLVAKGDGGDCLLLLHGRKSADWGFPKGHLDDGEDVFAAAKRELREETGVSGVRVEAGFRFHVRYRVRTRGGSYQPKKVTYYLARVTKPEITLSDEHDEFRWVSLEDAERLLAHENLRTLAREAIGYFHERRS